MADRYSVRELLMLGDINGARELHDALNKIDAAFGYPPLPMPEPARQHTGLIYAPADKVTPGEFLRVLDTGDWRIVRDNDPETGNERVAA